MLVLAHMTNTCIVGQTKVFALFVCLFCVFLFNVFALKGLCILLFVLCVFVFILKGLIRALRAL